MSHTVKIYDTCIGCTQCVRACPTDVLEMVPWDGCRAGQIASAPRTEDCVGCKRCETACPTDFLSASCMAARRDDASSFVFVVCLSYCSTYVRQLPVDSQLHLGSPIYFPLLSTISLLVPDFSLRFF